MKLLRELLEARSAWEDQKDDGSLFKKGAKVVVNGRHLGTIVSYDGSGSGRYVVNIQGIPHSVPTSFVALLEARSAWEDQVEPPTFKKGDRVVIKGGAFGDRRSRRGVIDNMLDADFDRAYNSGSRGEVRVKYQVKGSWRVWDFSIKHLVHDR